MEQLKNLISQVFCNNNVALLMIQLARNAHIESYFGKASVRKVLYNYKIMNTKSSELPIKLKKIQT